MKQKLNFPGPDPEDMPEDIRRTMDMADRITAEAALRVANEVDDQITAAIQLKIGMDWKPMQLTGRLHRTIYLDGSEIMALDGVPILHIGPWKWVTTQAELTATRECTHLKGADDTLPN